VCYLFALNLGNDRFADKKQMRVFMETDVGFFLMVEFDYFS